MPGDMGAPFTGADIAASNAVMAQLGPLGSSAWNVDNAVGSMPGQMQKNPQGQWVVNSGPGGYEGFMNKMVPALTLALGSAAFAPAIAADLGGGVAGAAGAGAATGAGGAALTGQNIGKGALLGGAGGALGGALQSAEASTGALDALGKPAVSAINSGVSGGVGAALRGGNPLTGAATGAINSGLNTVGSDLAGSLINGNTQASNVSPQAVSDSPALTPTAPDVTIPGPLTLTNQAPSTGGTSMSGSPSYYLDYNATPTASYQTIDPITGLPMNTGVSNSGAIGGLSNGQNAIGGSLSALSGTSSSTGMSTAGTNVDPITSTGLGSGLGTSYNFTNPSASGYVGPGASSSQVSANSPGVNLSAGSGNKTGASGGGGKTAAATGAGGALASLLGGGSSGSSGSNASALAGLAGLLGIAGSISTGNTNNQTPNYQSVPGSALASYGSSSGSGGATSGNQYNWQNPAYGYQPRVQNPAMANATTQDWLHYGETPAAQKPGGGAFFTPAAGAPVNQAFGPSQQQPQAPQSSGTQSSGTQASSQAQQQQIMQQLLAQLQQPQASQLAVPQQLPPQTHQTGGIPLSTPAAPTQTANQGLTTTQAGNPASPLAQLATQAPAAVAQGQQQQQQMPTANQGLLGSPLSRGMNKMAEGGPAAPNTGADNMGGGNYFDDVIARTHGLLGHHVNGAIPVGYGQTGSERIQMGQPPQQQASAQSAGGVSTAQQMAAILQALGQQQAAPATGQAHGGAIGGSGPLAQAGEHMSPGEHIKGEGDGTSDDIPAVLSDGEYVVSADVVSALGNGSNDAGAQKLDELMSNARKHMSTTHSKGKLGPKAKDPEKYLGKDE